MRERDDIPVMLLGLKRDLRVEEEGIIYPEEVSRERVWVLVVRKLACCHVLFREQRLIFVRFCLGVCYRSATAL